MFSEEESASTVLDLYKLNRIRSRFPSNTFLSIYKSRLFLMIFLTSKCSSIRSVPLSSTLYLRLLDLEKKHLHALLLNPLTNIEQEEMKYLCCFSMLSLSKKIISF